MTEDFIEHYDIFNTKGYPYELIFGYFNDQTIPYYYYNFLNDDYGDGNNIPSTPGNSALLENEVVEYSVVPNDEDINDDIIIDGDDSLASDIDPLQKLIMNIEGGDNENEGR